jgi:hypothetical protein
MSEEERIKLRYGIDFGGEITKEEVFSLVEQTIEEAKKKYPEKTKALEKIEIVDTGERIRRLAVDAFQTLIIEVILAPIIVETWHEIVIPLLKRKLNIEPYNGD